MREKISDKINKLLSLKLVKWVVIPCLLIIFWILFSLAYSSYRSFSVLQYVHNEDGNNNFYNKRILKAQRLTGLFKARQNNLGIVAVRFGDVPKVEYESEDTILFRIKEDGKPNWLYENRYKSGLFTQNEYFPFGFIEIENSQGRSYKFEVVSLKGNLDNAIQTGHTNPVYLSKYKFNKSEIFQNSGSIIEFLKQKLITFATNYDSLLSSTAFLLPLVFYLLWILLPTDRWVKSEGKISGKKLFGILILVLITFDVFFYEYLIAGFVLGLIGLWICSIYLNRMKSATTFSLAFLLILISIASIYFNLKISIEKTTTFAYLLMIVGICQSVFEYRVGKNKK